MMIYAAYGSNMDLIQMAYRCPDARMIGTGFLDGWRLLFKGSGSGNYATIEPAEGHSVPVVVWKISEADEESLDLYEGYPEFYYKVIMQIRMDDGSDRTGMAYAMHEKRKPGLPHPYYMDVLSKAYQAFGFDERILEEALEYSRPPEKS